MASTAVGTITTISSIGSAGGLLGIVTIVALLLVVFIKETGGGSRGNGRLNPGWQLLSRTLDAPILALVSVFVVIVAVRVWEILA